MIVINKHTFAFRIWSIQYWNEVYVSVHSLPGENIDKGGISIAELDIRK